MCWVHYLVVSSMLQVCLSYILQYVAGVPVRAAPGGGGAVREAAGGEGQGEHAAVPQVPPVGSLPQEPRDSSLLDFPWCIFGCLK